MNAALVASFVCASRPALYAMSQKTVTASEIERYRRQHLGQRTGFHDPEHPMHGKRGGGRRKKIDE